MPNPGRLRTRFNVQTLVEVPDPYGQPIQQWRDQSRRPGELLRPTVRDQVNADQLKVVISHVVIMRDDRAITETCRLVFDDGRILRIAGIVPDDQRHWMMRLLCVQQVGETTRDEDPGEVL